MGNENELNGEQDELGVRFCVVVGRRRKEWRIEVLGGVESNRGVLLILKRIGR